MRKIAIVGAGGFGRELYCIWKDTLLHNNEEYEFLGYYDDTETLESNMYGPVLGTVDDLNKVEIPLEVAIAVGSPKSLQAIRGRITNSNISFPNVVHPSVKILDKDNISIGEGNIFAPWVYLSCNISIGDFNLFNTKATLGHDIKVGDYNVFGPNTQVSGNVVIGDTNLFGFNCGIIQRKKIGNRNTLGAGSILLKNIKDEATYFGNPAVKWEF